ncbi:proline-rich transmembrane protein 1-like [Ananas comosus]|uniref:Proline-rich transmembrane protein 1-like n=1 Tax=Ananas comosus TaxID=4615 RepID=A0A6P5F9F2_ANACO|nr:proline-rich transmembrane protein 1-like [Ananas comosus]
MLPQPCRRPRSPATLPGRSPPPLRAGAATSVNHSCPDLLGLSRASEVSLRTAAPWTTSAAFFEASATLPVGRCRPSKSSPPPRALGAAAPACRPSQARAATPEPRAAAAVARRLLPPPPASGNPPPMSPTYPGRRRGRSCSGT